MWVLLLVASLGGVSITATPHTGSSKTGELLSVKDGVIRIQAEDGPVDLPFKTLKGLTFNPPEGATFDPHTGPVVELVDGSKLAATTYAAKDGEAFIKTGQGEIKVSTRRVKAVLLRNQRNFPSLQETWRALLDGPRTGDLVVVRRTRDAGGERVENTLDQLDCVLYDMDAKQLTFARDGNRRQVPLEKLEGVVYFHPQAPELASPLAVIQTHDDAEFAAHQWQSDGEKVSIETRAGVAVTLAASEIKRVRFEGGDVVYLSDLKPQSIQWRPFIPTQIGSERLEKLYAPRFDEANNGDPLRLEPGGDVYEKGIALHSRTELIYRLTQPYKRLQADVGLDPRFRHAGNVELVISSEKGQLFRKAVTPDAPRFELDVDIDGARRLTIVVDFGEGWDVSDYLNLCDARVSK